MAAQPAFTPVAASRTLPSKPVAAVPSHGNGVSEYVQRAFFEYHKVKNQPTYASITDEDVRAKLAEVVRAAMANGSMERSWDSTPLPHLLILEERHKAALHVSQNSMLTTMNLTSPLEPASKKRKSPDGAAAGAEPDLEAVTLPWKKADTKLSLADRITGKSKTQDKKRKDKDQVGSNPLDSSQDILEKRRQRFGYVSPEPTSFLSTRDISSSLAKDSGPIVGTCQTLEKNYFRLTAPPNPNTVRPLPVLKRSLDLITANWKQQHDYSYFCDQMKSMRQDLTVQRIKNEFTIKVYELHARIALEKRDLGEYNQCQTQLRALYKMKLGANGTSCGNKDEFTAYRILYLIYTCSRTDMNNMLADLTTADKKGIFVQHALRVRSALASGNYHKFFILYAESQDQRWNMVPYLMDMFIERERLSALAAICKSYKPDVSFESVVNTLAFDCDVDESFFSEEVNQRCSEFITKHGGASAITIKDDGSTRLSTGKAGNVFENARRQAFGKVDIKGQI